jgi:hypothetical protein
MVPSKYSEDITLDEIGDDLRSGCYKNYASGKLATIAYGERSIDQRGIKGL